MASFSKLKLSGSVDGKGIKVAAAATPGTVIHTAVVGVADLDEIMLWVVNMDVVDRILTLEWGGVTVPDNTIQLTIPFKAGLFAIVPGILLQNTLIVRAFGDAANVLVLYGHVNRITA
jgi:hypothetical protein